MNKRNQAIIVLALSAGMMFSGYSWQAAAMSDDVSSVSLSESKKETASVYSLKLDTSDYKDETMQYNGEDVHFRAYENRVYVSRPADANSEMMSIYIPNAYLEGKKINGDRKSVV